MNLQLAGSRGTCVCPKSMLEESQAQLVTVAVRTHQQMVAMMQITTGNGCDSSYAHTHYCALSL